jgi:5,10-methylenetetrahydromethanopterin reductase
MLSLGIAGDATEVIARCRVLYTIGARHLSFGPPLGPDPVAAIGLLGSQVLPALRDLPERPGADPVPADEGPGIR